MITAVVISFCITGISTVEGQPDVDVQKTGSQIIEYGENEEPPEELPDGVPGVTLADFHYDLSAEYSWSPHSNENGCYVTVDVTQYHLNVSYDIKKIVPDWISKVQCHEQGHENIFDGLIQSIAEEALAQLPDSFQREIPCRVMDDPDTIFAIIDSFIVNELENFVGQLISQMFNTVHGEYHSGGDSSTTCQEWLTLAQNIINTYSNAWGN